MTGTLKSAAFWWESSAILIWWINLPTLASKQVVVSEKHQSEASLQVLRPMSLRSQDYFWLCSDILLCLASSLKTYDTWSCQICGTRYNAHFFFWKNSDDDSLLEVWYLTDTRETHSPFPDHFVRYLLVHPFSPDLSHIKSPYPYALEI